jgi:hypothetical protein
MVELACPVMCITVHGRDDELCGKVWNSLLSCALEATADIVSNQLALERKHFLEFGEDSEWVFGSTEMNQILFTIRIEVLTVLHSG